MMQYCRLLWRKCWKELPSLMILYIWYLVNSLSVSDTLGTHQCSLDHARVVLVEIRLSDMYFLCLRVRQCLGAGFLLSELDLPYSPFPPCHSSINQPVCNTVPICFSCLLYCLLWLLLQCQYILLFHCINSGSSRPSEIEWSSKVSLARACFQYIT